MISRFFETVPRKVLPYKLLNICGIQVFRILTSHLFHRLRRPYRSENINPIILRLRKDGIIVIPNFLSEKAFQDVQNEFAKVFNRPDIFKFESVKQGSALLSRFRIFDNAIFQQQFPETANHIFNNFFLNQLFMGAERIGDFRLSNCELQVVQMDESSDEADYESFLHQDTFFPTFKAWLYINDVNEKNAPFVYVPGSNRINIKRLIFEYMESVRNNDGGSWRVTSKFKNTSQIKEQPYFCAANTLVLANTYGFHCRGPMVADYSRKAIHISVRINPWKL